MERPSTVERPRRISRAVHVGPVQIGGGAPISVQSMTTGKTHDVEKCVAEITRLAEAGADIVRVAVPRPEDADALAEIVAGSPVPIVADIHFNYQYALQGARGGRGEGAASTPATSASRSGSARCCSRRRRSGIPIRIGVNSGSLEKDILDKYGYPQPEALFESAMRHVEICERERVRGPRHLGQALRRVLHDPELPPPRRADRLPAPPRRDRERLARRRAPSSRPSASARCSPTASATRSASRSPPTPCTRSRSATRS